MDQAKAAFILAAIKRGDIKDLALAKVKVFGNKGRLWSNTACITDLDEVKGECNPRLSSNSCTVENIGCPKCMEALEKLAQGERQLLS